MNSPALSTSSRPVTPQPSRRTAGLIEVAARLSRTMAVARGLVRAGRHVELTGIDDGVGLLCAQTLDLDPAQGREMLPHLYEVRSQLDGLYAAITEAAPQTSLTN